MAEAKQPAKKGPPPVSPPKQKWKALKSIQGVPYYYNTETKELSSDKPAELKSYGEKDDGSQWVWIPDDTSGFVAAKIIKKNSDSLEVEDLNHKSKTLDKKQMANCVPLSYSSLAHIEEDMVMCDDMSEAFILHNLTERFKTKEIYTNIADILVSVNPYENLPIYSAEKMAEYHRRLTQRPHVFLIAANAFHNFRDTKINQSVIISGESGAGKTEATKQVLKYLAQVAGSQSRIEEKVLSANPILEAFGNAKTIRNNNSSRFGKYIQVFFDADGVIRGATNTNYLLEKQRVVVQSKNERNFHIFYQLVEGVNKEQKQALDVLSLKDYYYLSLSGCSAIPNVNDASDFKEVTEAMHKLGFSEEEKITPLTIVSAILHLGNTNFKDTGEKKCELTDSKSMTSAAKLLQVTPELLQEVLLTRKLKAGNTVTVSYNSKSMAEDVRNAISKFLYTKLFDWLIRRVNQAMQGDSNPKAHGSIGILDIFGFEIFDVNSFEQLCINFTNEKLQQHFNHHTFQLEENEYKREKIVFDHVDYKSNQDVIDLIEKPNQGLLPMLDEECRMPKSDDKTFLAKVYGTYKGHARIVKDKAFEVNFSLKHYAATVLYNTTGWMEKNRDQISADTAVLLSSSQLKLLKEIIGDDLSANKSTLGFKFSQQLIELMDTLNQTEPHYIRCIKPNETKAKMTVTGTMVLNQLRYAGVFEAVSIRKQGFPYRLTHPEFKNRYACIDPKAIRDKDPVEASKILAKAMNQEQHIKIGVSKILYRAPIHRVMELYRNLAWERSAQFCQSRFRGRSVRKMYKIMKEFRTMFEAAKGTGELADIEKAIDFGKKIKFPMRLYHDAQEMKKDFIMAREMCSKGGSLTSKQLLDKMDSARTQLGEAIAIPDENKLKAAIEFANSFGFNVPVVKDAENLLKKVLASRERVTKAVAAVVEKEILDAEAEATALKYKPEDLVAKVKDVKAKIAVAKEKLKTSMDAVNEAQVNEAIAYCEGIKYQTEVVDQCKALRTKIVQCREHLTEALKEVNEDKLLKSTAEADGFKYATDQVTEAKGVIAKVVTAKGLMAEGMNLVNEAKLRSALEYCVAFRYQTAQVDEVRAKIAQIEKCKEHITEALQKVDEQLLRNTIAEADGFGYKTEKVDECRTVVAHIEKCKQDIANAITAVKELMLKACLDDATSFRYVSKETQACAAKYDQLLKAKKMIEEAVNAPIRLEATLVDVVKNAESFNYNEEAVVYGKGIRDVVLQFNQEAKVVLDFVDEPHMDNFLRRGKELRVDTDDTKLITKLLADSMSQDGPVQESFVRLQLDSCYRHNDQDRAFRVKVRLRDLILRRTYKNHEIPTFPNLFEATLWTSKKWFCFDKIKFASKMLKHSHNIVHYPLTKAAELNKGVPEAQVVQEARDISYDILIFLKYYEPRKYLTRNDSAFRIVEAGMSKDYLRDEIYIQIIKQLQSNPEDSRDLAWQLLGLCLMYFIPRGGDAPSLRDAPSDDGFASKAENVLDVFLASTGAIKHRMRFLQMMLDKKTNQNVGKPSVQQFDEVFANFVGPARNQQEQKEYEDFQRMIKQRTCGRNCLD